MFPLTEGPVTKCLLFIVLKEIITNLLLFPIISGHPSRQHSCPASRSPLGHQREWDDQGFPQAKDQGRKRLRHQGTDQGKLMMTKQFWNYFNVAKSNGWNTTMLGLSKQKWHKA